MNRMPALLCLLVAASVRADVLLRVRETAGVGRVEEVVRSGVPLPRGLGVTSTASLAVVDANGAAVPAEFRILARWNAPLADSGAPVQWLLMAFPATVGANATSTYRLVTNGTNPAPAAPLRLTRNGEQVVVDTGKAVFAVGASAALFDSIRRNDSVVVSGGQLTARIDDRDVAFAATRRIAIEASGPLSAVVVIDGTYGSDLGTHRRYVFTAGSPTAIVQQTLSWEGDRCGSANIVCGGRPNAVHAQRVRDTLTNTLGTTQVMTIGAMASPPIVSTGTTSLRQLLRANRHAPPSFEVSTTTGTKADGGVLAVTGSGTTLAIALDHMHRYEPQALRVLEDGTLAIDLDDGNVWIGARQAMFTTLAVAAMPAIASRTLLDRDVWAPLNHPLRAWPDASWFAASGAVGDLPAGALPSAYADYDTAVASALNATVTKTDEVGVFGLMTYGSFPRFWGTPIYTDEVDCGDGDPTPDDASDDLYWCSTWTDYHNTAATAVTRAMRSGEVGWLDELARPAALRMLYTQIFQCSPADDFFYCGQAPAGYGGFRENFNSSHAYFENLYLYYWLTGDSTVVDTLQRGARSMRNYFCSRRPAAACLAGDPPTDEFANLTGRVASQWFATFRFVGLASDDGSYLDDYRNNLARAVTQQYLALDRDNKRYGFLLGGDRPVTTSGTNTTDQLWMTALYDMADLARLQVDTNDAPLGDPPLRPSEVLVSLARTFERYGSRVAPGGDGTAAGAWPNQLDVTWSGARIGGALLTVSATPGGSDPLLYDTSKATLSGPMARAALLDPTLRPMADALTRLAIRASIADGSPLGKLQGEFLTRLHEAVASLAPPPAVKRRAAAR